MNETKSFHIGDILSVTHERLVSPDHIGGVYNVLGWMVDEELMSHQLPRVADECAPFLRETFPDLAGIDVEGATITSEAECVAWLASLEPRASVRHPPRRAETAPPRPHEHCSDGRDQDEAARPACHRRPVVTHRVSDSLSGRSQPLFRCSVSAGHTRRAGGTRTHDPRIMSPRVSRSL